MIKPIVTLEAVVAVAANGVCRQRIADAINNLKAKGQISVLTVPPPEGSNKHPEYYYELWD